MKKRILIVDDQTDYSLLMIALREYEIRVECDSTRAMATALEFQPDIFLLDMIMPEMHGTDLAEEIRRDACFQSTPIIFVSALVHSRRNDGKPVQIGDYPALGKPFSVAELRRCISEHLAGGCPGEPISPGILAGS